MDLLKGTSPQAAWIGSALLTATGLAWWVTARLAGSDDMLMSVGMMAMHSMSFGEAVAFLGMWVAMMVAMMVPVVTPTVMAHRMVRVKQGDGNLSTVVFAGGYLTVWFGIGLLPLVAFLALPRLVDSLGVTPLLFAAGALFVAGGLYQLTAWKEACLRHCRHPLDFLMTHDFSRGLARTFRAGLVHGAFCLGCCWGLMLVVIAVGMTNLMWMAVVAVLFVAERWAPWGDRLHLAVTPVLVGMGVWVLLGTI